MHGDYRVVDADGHVIEPANLWLEYIDAEFREQAPRCYGAMSVDVLGHRMPDVPGWKEANSSVATRRTADPRFAFAIHPSSPRVWPRRAQFRPMRAYNRQHPRIVPGGWN